MKTPSSTSQASQNRKAGGTSGIFKCLTVAVRDLDFEHLHAATGKGMNLEPVPSAPSVGARKRKNTFENEFSDVAFDDFVLDEDDLKELDRLESPQKLPNGNLKCNHSCKDRTKYSSEREITLKFDRCRHLCCKEGKVSKKSKATGPISKTKKISLPAPNLTKNDGSGGQSIQGNDMPMPNPSGDRSGLSPFKEILVETLEYQINENPYSNGRSDDVAPENEYFTKSTTAIRPMPVPTSDAFQPPKRTSPAIVSGKPGLLEHHRIHHSQRRATSSVDDIAGDSDDDLPSPDNLLAKIMPKEGMVPNSRVSFIQVPLSSIQGIESAAGRNDDFAPRLSNENDILFGGVAFSVDDIMECVEIV